jgi:phosphatidylserine/phosphatidylglycerophosphate/cardiolipin synthase-like enzyme
MLNQNYTDSGIPHRFSQNHKGASVEIRIKPGHEVPMHLKSYQIDGRGLRTGAANFSASGLKRQDNDLVVIENGQAGAAFKRNFDVRFASGEALQVGREE